MMFLLDVNVLLALNYPTHVHYGRVRSWVHRTRAELEDTVFATCPITELGFIRVSSGKAGYAINVESTRATCPPGYASQIRRQMGICSH